MKDKLKEEHNKLKSIELDLVNLIFNTENKKLQDTFLNWQGQRNICNELFVNLAGTLLDK